MLNKKNKLKKEIEINISAKYFYILIVSSILILGIIGVYASTAGTAPNPGHLINEFSAPSTGCTNGQILKLSNGDWTCADISTGGSNLPTCTNGQILNYSGGNWVCVNPPSQLLEGNFYFRFGQTSCFSGDTLVGVRYANTNCQASNPCTCETWRCSCTINQNYWEFSGTFNNQMFCTAFKTDFNNQNSCAQQGSISCGALVSSILCKVT